MWLKDLSFIGWMKDKTQDVVEGFVLHRVDEGQNPGCGGRICPSWVSEGQNSGCGGRICPS
jgi:hypothetical protein